MLFRWFDALDCPTVPVRPSGNPSPTYLLFHIPEFRPWTASRFDALAGRPTREAPLPSLLWHVRLSLVLPATPGETAYPAYTGPSTLTQQRTGATKGLGPPTDSLVMILGHHNSFAPQPSWSRRHAQRPTSNRGGKQLLFALLSI